MSLRKYIIDRIRGTPPIPEIPPKVMELTSMSEGELEKIEETRSKSGTGKYRKLYEKDGLTFTLVNYLIGKIGSQQGYWEGDPEIVKEAEAWSSLIGLKFINKNILKNTVLDGTCFIEMLPTKARDGIHSFKFYKIEEVDFIRDKENKIILDDLNRPLGFVITRNHITRKVYADKVVQKDDVILKARKGEDLRDHFAWFVLEGYGDSLLGISLIEPVYRSAIIRSNISDMVGEAAFRGGGIVAYYTGQPPQEVIDAFSRDLKSITRKNIFLLSDKWKLSTIPSPDVKEVYDMILYLADEESLGIGPPLELLMTSKGMYKTDLGTKLVDFENRISIYQEYFCHQFNIQVTSYLKKLWGVLDKQLRYVLTTSEPSTKTLRSRVLSTLARRGLIRWDPELELKIRKEEGLPTSFIEQQLEEWKTKKIKTEEDIKEKEIDVDQGEL